MKNLRQLFLLATLAYVVWAGLFIHNTSFVIDGTRYYCLFDDAMISMRYAENWVNGRGIVWNEGEYVEGYTNPLQVILMAGCLLIAPKIQAVLLVQLLGIGMVIACSWLAGKIFENIRGSSKGIWIVWLGVYLLYPLSYWSLMGMETGLVSALLLAGIYLATNPSKTPNGWVLGGVLALLYLARPDASLYGFLIIGYLGYQDISLRKFPSEAVKALLALIGTIAGHIAWRLHYYGELKPNTAILKLGGWDTLDRLSNGIAYMDVFGYVILPLFIFSALSILVYPSKLKAFLALLILSSWGYQIYTGGDAWFYWRILTPATLVMIVLTAEVGLHLGSITANSKTTRKPIATALLAVSFALLVLNRPMLREQLLVTKAHTVQANLKNIKESLAIRAVSTPNASVGLFWAGSIPYFADRKGIDFLGKCDPVVAKMKVMEKGAIPAPPPMKTLPGHNKVNMKHSIQVLQPTFIQNVSLCDPETLKWVQENYAEATVMGIPLIIKRNCPEVRWK